MSGRSFFPLLILLVLNSGCGEEQAFRKPTTPATGTVTVDGMPPGSGIQIQCHPAGAPDTEHPTVSSTETDAEGKFAISTYESGDGLPAGDYTLTFTWQEFDVITRSYSGVDKLNGRYSDPASSTIKLTVKEGEENDLGVVALTTK